MFSNPSFDDLEAVAHASIQGVFGKAWVHVPMCKRPNCSPSPDPARPRYGLDLIFSWEPRLVKLGMEDMGVSSRDPKLFAQVCDLQYPVKIGDQFQQCSTGLLFEVTNPMKDGMSGIEIDVVQMGRST